MVYGSRGGGSGGAFLLVVGVWLFAQVVLGDLIGRLNSWRWYYSSGGSLDELSPQGATKISQAILNASKPVPPAPTSPIAPKGASPAHAQ